MIYNVHGTCGRCGGRVTTPRAWGGIHPPVPTCEACGASVKLPHGPVLDMDEPPKRYDNVADIYKAGVGIARLGKDEELGKIWALEGYLLKERLSGRV